MKARADEEKPTVITYSGEIKLDVVVQEAIYNATCALQFKLEIMRNSNSWFVSQASYYNLNSIMSLAGSETALWKV